MIYSVLNFWRSVPAILAYKIMPDKSKISMDIKRNSFNDKKSDAILLHRLLLNNKAFRNVFYVHMAEYSRFICKLLKLFYSPLKGLEIDGNIGGGFIVYHGYSSVLFAHSIGSNCSAYQQVTLGRGKKDSDGIDIPIIGNNVDIFAGAIIVGGVHIGNNCKIGAGAVVTKDIPPNCTVIGNPCTIIKMDGKRVNIKP